MPMIGTSGGQDMKRRAALTLYNQLGGQPGAAQGAAPAASPGGTTVESLLRQAVQLTFAQPDPGMIRQNIEAWRQASFMLAEMLKQSQGGEPQGPRPTPAPAVGAQAAAPAFGRPPR